MTNTNNAAAELTPFLVTFRVGRRTLTAVRFGTDATQTRILADKVINEGYFGKARILSVEPTSDPRS